MTTQTPKSSPLTSIFNSLSSLSPTPSTIQPPTQTQTRAPIEELTRILPSDQPPSTTTTSPLHNLSTEDTERARSLFLTLHVLFPHELLPALDLLDRGLVTRMTRLHSPSQDNEDGGAATNSGTADTKMDSDFHHSPSSASPNPNPTARPRASNATSKPECECGCEVEVFYIQSASSTTTMSGRYSHRNRKAAPASARAHASTFYEVRLDSWNCSCPAFSVSAFQGMGMGMGLYLDNNNTATAIQSTEAALARPSPFKSDSSALGPVPEADADADAGHQQWRFGGVATNLQESRPSAPHSMPSCKHILAAVLAKVAPGLFAKHGVIQKAVTHEELVGWGAGWGEFGGG
ncbi:hypothetical protein LTR72_005932 [Exophiala xenobiotica]|nr:hypothetical protein LTR72_005932 [Exophiala xenobiotica]KAK5297087.1 hypothetical protein LTR14_002818 [Exophiala xenobiotica]KAK5433255.1 hypothetical protein LTR18_010975 [Exophiala xenobiotica]KAK5470465.1 hypothetical protein LTR55_010964 [Exophiala xenobiotica]